MLKVVYVNWKYLVHELNIVFSLLIVGSQKWVNGAREAVEASESKNSFICGILEI